MVLAGIVTLGLVTFYLNSQIMWTQSSTQVMGFSAMPPDLGGDAEQCSERCQRRCYARALRTV
jgi:hypothetical protein